MAISQDFELDGKRLHFDNSGGGVETISFNGKVLSSMRTVFRGGRHSFEIDNDTYEVKVNSGLSGVSFKCKKNGVALEEEAQTDKIIIKRAVVMGLLLWIPLFVIGVLIAINTDQTGVAGIWGGVSAGIIIAAVTKIPWCRGR